MTNHRELLPPGGSRKVRTAEQITAAAAATFDYPATQVGVVGNITVYYDSSLGAQGLALAQQLVNAVSGPYNDMQSFFGISGGSVSVVVAPLSGNNDGSGGAYHYGCDFTSGGVLYLDATFANTSVNPLDLEVGLYVAELSESFMGPQGGGWGCGFSNGEGLSRFCAEQETPAGTLSGFATGPAWAQAGFPDWVTKTEQTDRDSVSTGCAIIYLYWMCSLGFTIPKIIQAGGSTLSANYQTLTGKSSAYQDLSAAVKGLSIQSDNPFPLPPQVNGWLYALYADLLGRAPDSGGLAFWAWKLIAGAPFTEIANGFLNSQEYSAIVVNNLYQQLLSRGSDPTGLASWTKALEQATPLQQIILGFCNSTEYLTNNPPPAQFVESLYNRLLGRPSDPAGKQDWINALNAGKGTEFVINGFLTSQEYCTDRVTELYETLLGRQPDPTGLAGWVHSMTSGTPFQQIKNGFLASSEYLARARTRFPVSAAVATSNGAVIPGSTPATSKAENQLKALGVELGMGRAIELLQREHARVRAAMGGSNP